MRRAVRVHLVMLATSILKEQKGTKGTLVLREGQGRMGNEDSLDIRGERGITVQQVLMESLDHGDRKAFRVKMVTPGR